jgi:hypothetical protein
MTIFYSRSEEIMPCWPGYCREPRKAPILASDFTDYLESWT